MFANVPPILLFALGRVGPDLPLSLGSPKRLLSSHTTGQYSFKKALPSNESGCAQTSPASTRPRKQSVTYCSKFVTLPPEPAASSQHDARAEMPLRYSNSCQVVEMLACGEVEDSFGTACPEDLTRRVASTPHRGSKTVQTTNSAIDGSQGIGAVLESYAPCKVRGLEGKMASSLPAAFIRNCSTPG